DRRLSGKLLTSIWSQFYSDTSEWRIRGCGKPIDNPGNCSKIPRQSGPATAFHYRRGRTASTKQEPGRRKEHAMQVRTGVKSGGVRINRCENVQRKKMMVVRTNIKAGGLRPNRCETIQRRE